MTLEVAILYIKAGLSDQFEIDFKTAGQYLSSAEGYIRHSLQKCEEVDNKYILLVEWRSINDHLVGFRESAIYNEWKALLHHYYDPFPIVEHYQHIS